MRRKNLSQEIDKILRENITLHSIRGGYGVFNITSFEKVRDQILNVVRAWASHKGIKEVDSQPIWSEK